MNFKTWLKAELAKGEKSKFYSRKVGDFGTMPYGVLKHGVWGEILLCYSVFFECFGDIFKDCLEYLKDESIFIKVPSVITLLIALPFFPLGWAFLERQRALNSYREWYIEEKVNHLHQ